MNAGRAFDRDMLWGSTGGPLIDNNSFRNGRVSGLQQFEAEVIVGGHDVRLNPLT
jgi:hypothetical protein